MTQVGITGKQQLTDEQKLSDLEYVIRKLSEALSVDGGSLRLVSADIPKATVTVSLSGACESCAISTITISEGIERIIKQRLPWVKKVVGEIANELDFFESIKMGKGAYVPKKT
jgi:Fe-S cluster biogenesis protein NfuA